MRKIVITEFLTLDGVMEDPGGSESLDRGGWSFQLPDPDGAAYKLKELQDHDALLLGRVTYEGFAAAWPSRTDDAGFADKFNRMPKFVVTSKPDELTWENSSQIGGDGDLAAALTALQHGPGGDLIVHGSGTLARWLLANDLADELRLMIFPIVLGAGQRLFGETDAALTLSRTHVQPLESGTVIVHYGRR